MYILEGEPILVTDTEEISLSPGMCAGFPAKGIAHHLVNRTANDVVYLEIGDRTPGDEWSPCMTTSRPRWVITVRGCLRTRMADLTTRPCQLRGANTSPQAADAAQRVGLLFPLAFIPFASRDPISDQELQTTVPRGLLSQG